VHCSYCAFAVSTDDTMQKRYFDALLAEIDARATGEMVDTLYFGGGTPSRTNVATLARIFERLHGGFELAREAEFSMEANPEDVTVEAIALWQSLGVNRLSIGVQSFDDRELRPIGRVHGAEVARNAVRLAVASGLRISLDLILGLPMQTEESFGATLQTAIDLAAGHVSVYMLDLEEGTALQRQVANGVATIPDDDLIARLYVESIDRLRSAGFQQYEISNFAKPGEECRHNLRYWRREPYFGFGMSAHSFIGERRFANSRDLARYIAAPTTVDFVEELTDVERKRETIFLRLRRPSGLDYEEVVQLCGKEGEEWIEQGVGAGWLRRDGSRVAFTANGFLVSNELISQLF
jgi:oxygen-independent coproporphyrinogen-3 oxidase